MSNRNFDSRVVIQRLRDKNMAQNFAQFQQNGQSIINNPQTSDPSPQRIGQYYDGAGTAFVQNLLGSGYTVDLGATANFTPSTPSVQPTPSATVPDAPTGITAIGGNGQAIIIFTPPANNGGSSIISYTVTSSPGGITATASSPITVTGLTNGTSYTFTVVATNSVGDSVPSTASNPVTPSAPVYGTARLATSFYDDANLGYTTLTNTFGKICTDQAYNFIVGSYARTSTYTLNKPDADGITQIVTLTDSFSGAVSVSQGATTYYTYNLYITKYNTSGVPQWAAKIASDTNIGNTLYDVACDSNNNVYTLIGNGAVFGSQSIVSYYNADGSVFGTVTNVFGFGNFIPARYSLIKYNSSGQIQWVNSITAGDNNNGYVLANTGSIAIDTADNVYISCQVQRAGGGSGPTSIKFYTYSSVASGVIQFTLTTSDSYAFGGSPAQIYRGMLIKLTSSGTYTSIARMVIPTAWGENNGGTINTNIVCDSTNNVYLCLNSGTASSPTCNIYNGVAMTSNPLPTPASGYYRIDLRGNSISPPLPQFHKVAAIAKFNSSGEFQGACCAHQLRNSSTTMDLVPLIGINKTTQTLYMALRAQGFIGTNAGSGTQLNKLYIDSFSSNNTNGSDYDVFVTNTFNVTLAQPQNILAIINYNASLVAQSVAYIDTPPPPLGNSGSGVSVDSAGNIYVATTIKDNTSVKTIYEFDSLSGTDAVFNTFGTVTPINTNTDGLIVSYSGDLTTARWATIVTSSDGLNDDGFASVVDTANNIYVGGTSTLDNTAGSNSIGIYNYSSVNAGAVETTLFGNMTVTDATDRAGFVIKYE